MPKENPAFKPEGVDLIKLLAPQTKMRMLLEVFDLGKDKEKNEERKKKFIELMGKYHAELIKKKANIISDEHRAELHNKILEILRNLSLSVGLSEEQRQLTEYLSFNRSEVETMIATYFLGYNPSNPREQSELKQAMRGEGNFTSPPWEEKE